MISPIVPIMAMVILVEMIVDIDEEGCGAVFAALITDGVQGILDAELKRRMLS